MAFVDTTWYISSVAYAAVTVRPQNTAVVAGVVRKQFTPPAVGGERCFVCIVAGTTANVTDATWVTTRGAKTTDGTVTWIEVTGQPAVNGDLASTLTWAQHKALGGSSQGTIIKRNNGASYQVSSSGPGILGASEPAFSDTAGVTTADSSTTWTSLGPVGNFSAWGAPFARLASVFGANWGAPGNKFYLADNHAETQATSLTLLSPATSAGGPTYTICVDRTAALPPVEANYRTGATITTTGTSNIILTILGGSAYYQGIAFSCGDAGGSINMTSTAVNYIFKNCAFSLASNTSSIARIAPGGTSGSFFLWDNCTVSFGHTNQSIAMAFTNFEWKNTPNALQGSLIPTALFQVSGGGFVAVCRGVDLSAFSGQLLKSDQLCCTPIVMEDCKFHASMTLFGSATSAGYSTSPVITVRCDSGATNYKTTRNEYVGVQTVETSITRVGGATDGTQAQSTKIVTNTQATFLTPYRMLRLAAWNDVTAANRTVTVCGTINSASLPTDGEIWMDVMYLGSSSSPVASFKTTSKSHPLATAVNVSSDGSTWNGGGSGVGWSPFKLVATLTSPQPQMKGYVYASIRAAKASTTYYIDPQITLS